MYARSTTVHARPESIDAGIAHVRDEVMPALMGIDGYVGLSMLVDRRTRRCIVTSAWQSEQAMRASEDQLRPIRQRAAELLGGQHEVEEWEIVGLHRDHASRPGACVRATWVQVSPSGLEHAIDVYRMVVLPAMETVDGFCSASMMLNRASGRAVSSMTFDSVEAMEHNRKESVSVRQSATREARAEVLDVAEFELAIAHLRVPESA